MSNIDVCLSIAKEILTKRYPTLANYVIETLARQVVATPIDESLTEAERKRGLKKRVTEIGNSQFPHLRPRRRGQGGLINVGGAPPRGRLRAAKDHSAELHPESEKDIAEERLSRHSITNSASPGSSSILRDQERTADLVEEAIERVSPTNRVVLKKLLEIVGPGDSIRELGRQAHCHPPQVKRALDEAREVLEGRRPRRPGSVLHSTTEAAEYNPPTVSDEDRLRLHGGPIMSDIGAPDRRTNASNGVSNGHRREPRRRDIFNAPRPRRPNFVKHAQFGRGAVLLNLISDDKVWVEFDKSGADGKRRRIMLRAALYFLNGHEEL
jgi:hypothetical protein